MTLITMTVTYDTETKKTEVIEHDAIENFEIEVENRIPMDGFIMQIGDYTHGRKIDGYHCKTIHLPIKVLVYDDINLQRKKLYEQYKSGNL